MRKDRIGSQTVSPVPAWATQGAEARDWSWVEDTVWTERMVSALVNGVKGGRWYSLMDKVFAPDTLDAAWTKVSANEGAAGVDGLSIKRFEARAELYLTELSTALRNGTYCPQPIRRVEIPKGDGRLRPLGIPTVKDRIVQTAVKFALEPIFEAMFLPMSYGFRPGRGCRDALREVAQLIADGHTFVVDADFESYFDSIPHERLMQRVEERVSDGRILALLRSWLKQDIMHDLQRWTPTAGTPQGAVISPLLANIYLHPLDELMTARGYRMVRYADDFVVLCKNRGEADAALAEIRAWVAENGLRLHPNKTHVGDCRKYGEGFEFLGYRFEAGRRFVRKKSLDRSRKPGCSLCTQPGSLRDTLDEETTDWRAVCGKTARTVRRAGRASTLPDPYRSTRLRGEHEGERCLKRISKEIAILPTRRSRHRGSS